RAPVMLDHSGGGETPQPERGLETELARLAGEEAGGEQFAGASGVDQPVDRLCRDVGALTARYSGGPGLAAGHDQGLDVCGQRGNGLLDIIHLSHRRSFRLVGEQYVDLAVAKQLPE